MVMERRVDVATGRAPSMNEYQRQRFSGARKVIDEGTKGAAQAEEAAVRTHASRPRHVAEPLRLVGQRRRVLLITTLIPPQLVAHKLVPSQLHPLLSLKCRLEGCFYLPPAPFDKPGRLDSV